MDEGNIIVAETLEEAYISSRYMPREYERDESEELVNFAEKAVGFVKSIKGED